VTLPIVLSVPHAGTRMPPEVEPYACLSREEVVRDGDEQAAGIYLPSRSHVAHLVTTDVARAFVDLNRAEDDFRPDGVVKTHTCWDVPVYREFPPEDVIERLLERYHRPFHERLRELALGGEARVGVDAHTMAAVAPPVAPDPGSPRPAACVSDGYGVTCDPAWTRELARCLETALGAEVRINDPFQGGHIVRSHAGELPWVQLEISRGGETTVERKQIGVLEALRHWCGELPD
jgi:N-formylglutamate deformylase